MDKKLSLIIGGTGGIGLKTAEVLSKKDWKICLCGKNKTEDALKKLNGLEKINFYKIDICDKNSIEKIISIILEDHKRIDSVIYSVSIPIENKKIEDLTWDEFQKHIEAQIKGFFNLVQTILSKIKNQKIKFIVILTEYCLGKPPQMVSHYITAKYGLMGLVKSLASEIDATYCTFNMVSPGMTQTGLLNNLPPKLIEIVAEKNPMKRIADPVDIAKVISFLVSDESDYLNGVNILINGGNIFS